ncbi:shikimate kinase [Rarobacter faecitabidus]|uniref:Shikimate kinase n=1 Tax=Rarobacter faecitabidus TaxID=13243 RepID=A0A542ZVR5_RARFA|nr:shikimate kinase [Rarobacter faecitabidus]TQL64454.1 shikimate kinase [Rarobacter faecitabidus]
MTSADSRPLVVLVGPPGAGKSTVGSALAKRLAAPYQDLDEHIVAAAGSSIPQIFESHGEPHFRQLEAEALVLALTANGGVLALGGGAPIPERNRAALAEYAERGGTIVFLDLNVDVAVKRLGSSNTNRPLLAGDTRARFRALAEERRSAYESVATVTIDTSRLTPHQIAERIAQHVAARESDSRS